VLYEGHSLYDNLSNKYFVKDGHDAMKFRGRAKAALLRYLVAYGCCVAAFVGLLMVAYCIPSSAMSSQVKDSADLLVKEGNQPSIIASGQSTKIDNFTTAIMVSISAHDAAGGSVLAASMSDSYYANKGSQDKVQALEDGYDLPSDWSYPRYWHGYLVVLKPLLVFLDVGQIRLLFLAILALLSVAVCCRLAARTRLSYALAFAFSMTMVEAFIVAFSLSLAFSFFVALGGMLYVLNVSDTQTAFGAERRFGVVFFVIGAVTVFFDFLCTPIITLGLPLAAYLLVWRADLARVPYKRIVPFLFCCALAWSVGYASIWFTKWVLATIILGRDVVGEGIANLAFRTGESGSASVGNASQSDVARWLGAAKNLKAMLPGWKWKPAACVAVLVGVAFARCRRKGMAHFAASALMVAMLPYAWYLMAANHSYVHFWFVYRAQVITVFSVLSVVIASVDWKGVRAAAGKPFRFMRGDSSGSESDDAASCIADKV
jgi:hypothetical protein